MPCWECYDFEAAVAHEVGHVLGFGHPDAAPTDNLVGACDISNATCQRPFDCAAQAVYDSAEQSIMHSLTQHAPRTCLSLEDMRGLYFLYPLCDALQPTAVSCVKGRRLSGWLRLAIVVGVPFLLAVVAILVPLTCLRWRDQRRMRQLDRDLGRAHHEILEYRHALTQALRSTVRDAISRPTTALQSNANRPGTALNRLARAVGGNGRIHPVDTTRSGPETEMASRHVPGRPVRGQGEKLALEEVPETSVSTTSRPHAQSRPAQRQQRIAQAQTKPRAAQGVPAATHAKPTPGAGARQAAALNGYTGVAWPAPSTSQTS